LRFTLHNLGLVDTPATVVGEHGRNAIPVYPGELAFDEVTGQVRNFLKRIASSTPRVRNLATGVLLAQLVESIIDDRRLPHCVTCYHHGYSDWLTWPCIVGRDGVSEILEPKLGPRASDLLTSLLENRRLKKSEG
jgi:malate/lactate dehydrogenase